MLLHKTNYLNEIDYVICCFHHDAASNNVSQPFEVSRISAICLHRFEVICSDFMHFHSRSNWNQIEHTVFEKSVEVLLLWLDQRA
jgi:hypothetical protein